MKSSWIYVVALSLALTAAPRLSAVDSVTVSSISPAVGGPAQQLSSVSVSGTGFKLSQVPNPAGAVAFNGHNYLYVSTSMSWSDAKTYCESLNGHLVTINSAAENAFLLTLRPNNKSIWTGLTDMASEGTFVWITGEPLSYTNWAAGEPGGGTGENQANQLPDGTWNDYSNASLFAFVGEFESLPPSVKLVKGASVITGTNVRVSSSSQLLVDFNLTGAALGSWDVVVTDIDSGTTATLPGGFQIVQTTLLKVMGVSPAPGTAGLHTKTNIAIDFNNPVSAASITNTSVLLVRAGPDGVFDTSDDVAITIPTANLAMTTTTRLTITLTGLGLTADSYRLSLIGGIKGTTGSSDKMVTVPGFAQSIPTGDFTVEFWQRFDGATTNTPTTFELNPIVTGNNFRFRCPWNSGPDFLFWDYSSERHSKTNVNCRTGWHHFALVKTGATSQIYWNGALIINEASTATFSPYQGDLELPHAAPSQIFLGRIDEFRIWNIARTQSQVQTYMKRTMRGSEPGLLAYWDFNEGTGTAANDKTGHGFNGTMASPPVWNTSDVPLLAPVADATGIVLDGEFSGALPSGNNVAGGDFNVVFPLTAPPLFNVTAMVPAPNSTLTSAVTTVTLTLSAAVNAQTVNASSVTLKRAGLDGVLDTADDVTIVPASITVVGNNQIKLDLSSNSLPSDTYRVTLANGSIADANLVLLDGEFSGAFPTGNGTPGGAFQATFQLSLTPTTLTTATPAPISYGASSATLSAQVTATGQTVNAGTISFQLKNGNTAIGNLTTSSAVVNGSASVSYAIPAGTVPGNYTVFASYNNAGTFAGSSNNSEQLVINPAVLTVTPADVSRAYASANPALNGVISGLKNGDNITAAYVCGAVVTSDVGSYPIVPQLTDAGGKLSNYTVTLNNGSLTVTPIPLSVSGGSFTRSYGSANPALGGTIAGIKNADNITATYSTIATAASPVDAYPVVPTLVDPDSKLSNYSLTVNNGSLTITKAALSVTTLNASRPYGTANPVFSGNLSGVLNGDNILATYTSDATPASVVGLYAIMPALFDPDSKLTNYTLSSSNGTLSVEKAALSVTAADVSRPFGYENPTLTGTILGIKNNDNISATYETDAMLDSAIGNYDIVPALVDPDGKLSNYTATLTNGVLTVDAAVAPTITGASTASGTVGTVFAYSFTTSGSAPIALDASGLPPGLSLSGNSIAGTPTASGVFDVILSASNSGNTGTLALKVVIAKSSGVNHAPVFGSPPTASSNPASTAIALTLSAAATDSDGDALDYTWDFGDGTTGLGASVSKTYSTAGIYIVTVVVSDGAASDSQSLNLVVETAVPPGVFAVKKAMVSFNFIRSSGDSLKLSGTLPLPPLFDSTGKHVRILIGGVDKTFVLKAKGAFIDKSFYLKFKPGANTAAFTLSLSKQNLFIPLSDLGFSKTQSNPNLKLPVVLSLEGTSYLDTPILNYKAKSNKKGPVSGSGKN